MTFDYTPRFRKNISAEIWAPILTAELEYGDIHGLVEAVVDTGAETSSLPFRMMPTLRLDPGQCEDIGHGLLRPPGAFTVVLGEHRVQIAPVFSRHEDMLLGLDFLEHFRATFDGPARTFTLDYVS